jgi:dipeptidyl aminopeptidase/acylaminoacyl peptidase
MASALNRAKKKSELVIIKGGTHDLERQSDRVTLLTKVEAFLAASIGADGG